MVILPIIELRKWDGAVQSRWFKNGGLETLGARGCWWGNEIAGIVSGGYHGCVAASGNRAAPFIQSGVPIPRLETGTSGDHNDTEQVTYAHMFRTFCISSALGACG